jgi:hypothetical protein
MLEAFQLLPCSTFSPSHVVLLSLLGWAGVEGGGAGSMATRVQ